MSLISKNKIIYSIYIIVCLILVVLIVSPNRKEILKRIGSVVYSDTTSGDIDNQSDSILLNTSTQNLTQKEEVKNYINKDSLIGYWMVVGLGNTRYDYVKPNESDYDFLYYLKYMPVLFSENGEKIESYSSDLRINKLKWYFKSIDTLIECNAGLYRKYEVVNFKNETLKLNYCSLDSMNNPADNLYFTLCRIHPEKYTQQSLFSEELSAWRHKAKKHETDKAIKQRLKSLLLYNSVYIRSIYNSSYQALNTKHLHLPFDYYSNNMLFKTKLNSDNFNMLFKDSADASKAYQLLIDASANIKYPKTPTKDDYILEYAMYMDSLANRIKL